MTLVEYVATQGKRKITAWSNALKSYKKLSSGTRGHWVTKAGPSTKFVRFWKIPCQCCRGGFASGFSWYTLQSKEDLTTEVPKSMDWSSNLSTTLIENSEPCFACGRNQNDRESFRCTSPSSQRLLDQGKCPRQG